MKKSLFFLLFLGACQFNSGIRQNERSQAKLNQFPSAVFQEEGLRSRYTDATHLSYSAQHGTQVEFLSADGRTYLWYPGNRQLVVGEWKTQLHQIDGGAICFRYSPATFNPVTRKIGGNWSCQSAGSFIAYETYYTKGDPFRLSTGKIPFVLPKRRRLGFSYLQEKTGFADPL